MKFTIYKWYKKYRIHILIWASFILYESLVIGLVSGVFGHPITYFAHYFCALILFYVHAKLGLPWALKQTLSAIWKIPIIIIVEIYFFIMLCFLVDKFLIYNGIMEATTKFTLTGLYQLKMLYRGLYFAGFATGYYFLEKFNEERQKTNDLEKQKLTEIINRQRFEQQLAKAENDFLKAQINPHFLFNTLDFVYHNALSVSPIAADTIISLSEMMRFALDADKTGGYIILGDEIEQVGNLIYINQLRTSNDLRFTFDADKKVYNLFIIPLVLLTLVENVFKHGNLDDQSNPAIVTVNIAGNNLTIQTRNLINPYLIPSKVGGNGLNNIKQRLNYAYGNQATFSYKETANTFFEVYLSIPINFLTKQPPSLNALINTDREPPLEHVDFEKTSD